MSKLNERKWVATSPTMSNWATIVTCLALTSWGCANGGAERNAAATDNMTGTNTTDMNATGTNATSSAAEGASGAATMAGETEKAVAVLHPTKGSSVRGTVTFTREAGGVRVIANISSLKPGKHGFHAHENGDCSSPDAKSAGGHFNPVDMPHGAPDDEQRHAGDFGNLTADASGKARYDRLDTMISLSGANSIVGRAIIVHAKGDDLKSQPSGDAGDRESCGVVGIAQ